MKASMASNKTSSIEVDVELQSIKLHESSTASVSALPEDSGLEV